MRKARIAIGLLGVVVVVAAGLWLFVNSASRASTLIPRARNQSFFSWVRANWQAHFPPLGTYRLDITGTTGTPVVVGCRTDGSHSRVFRGVVPTNCVIQARKSVEVAIKNVGDKKAELGYSLTGVGGATRGGGGSGIGYQPYYGFSAQMSWSATSQGGGGGILYPTSWPETLPPGMTRQEAKTHDFPKEMTVLHLKDDTMRLAEQPMDHHLLVSVGNLNFQLKNKAAGEEAFQRFFASDCKDPMFLNNAVYEYVDNSGTNLDRAYELALKAQNLAPQDPYTADTVAWILHLRGYYQEALRAYPQNRVSPVVTFHIGMTHFMLMEEDQARTEFQKFVLSGVWSPRKEKDEASKCLGILDLKARSPTRRVVEKLKTRLVEAPDDPVALNRLGQLYEGVNLSHQGQPDEPLILKALGMRAYRRGDYARAAEFLAESGKSRTSDAELFYFLGMTRKQLNQFDECADSMRKAMALPLKSAQAQEANKVLAALPVPSKTQN